MTTTAQDILAAMTAASPQGARWAEQLAARIAELEARTQAAEADAARWRFLRDTPSCSFSLNYNDHRCMYETAEQTMEHHAGDPKSDYYGEVSADERAKMIDTNTIWTLHIYPNSPVGFNVYHAATLDTAIDLAMRQPGAGGG